MRSFFSAASSAIDSNFAVGLSFDLSDRDECRASVSDWTAGDEVPTVESERRVAMGVNQMLSIHANNLGEGVSIRAGADLMLVPDQTH